MFGETIDESSLALAIGSRARGAAGFKGQKDSRLFEMLRSNTLGQFFQRVCTGFRWLELSVCGLLLAFSLAELLPHFCELSQVF